MTKTIVEKLKLHKYKKVAVLELPEGANYLAELEKYDVNLTDSAYDLIFAFVLDMDSLQRLVHKVIQGNHLMKGGYLFAAYPKKGNKQYPTFIHRDDLFGGLDADEEGYVGESNIKFTQMVGLDEIFTVVGLKEDAKSKGIVSTKPSQRVEDYIEMVPKVEKLLQGTSDLLAFYQSLTPGYRKDWARYIYSAKQQETQEKRIEEMKLIFGKVYKTRELYRKAQE